MKVLIAEDDLSVCEMLQMFFQKEGYDAFYVHNGLLAEQAFLREGWDLIILDWMLPGKDGIALCKQIREASDTPVILLTAKDGEQERILGLELGADDYVTKPFSPMELIARMKAVQRRYKSKPASQHEAAAAHSEQKAGRISHRNISIDLNSRLVSIGERTLPNLTPKEFELFCLFVKHPRKVFTREQLLESVWGFDYFGEERTVDVHIKRLRNKVSTPEQPLVATVWGIGYRLEE